MARIKHVKIHGKTQLVKSEPSLLDVYFFDGQEILTKAQDRPHVSPSAMQIAQTPAFFRGKKSSQSRKTKSVKKSIDEISLLEVFFGDVMNKSEITVSPYILNTAVNSTTLIPKSMSDRNLYGTRSKRRKRRPPETQGPPIQDETEESIDPPAPIF
jgi:hypothetical protein